MRKFVYLVLCLGLVGLLAACSQSSPTPTPNQPNNPSAAAEIVSVTAPNATTVLVTFNQAMADNAANKANYEISNEKDGQFTFLTVTEAALNDDATQVTLTTLTQKAVRFTLKITNVTSKNNKTLDSSKNNTFLGKPGTGSGADTDGDGISDASELEGWTVTVQNGDTIVSTTKVTSDPNLSDTDNDGINDLEEQSKNTDPRQPDTDKDGLDDFQELEVFNSNPTNKDTDKDGLSDGDEVKKHKTSPILKDTDGDQIDDQKEVNLVNRNPKIADIPEPFIEVDNLGLTLDIKFTETKSDGTTRSEDKQVSSTLTESKSETKGTTDQETEEWYSKMGGSVTVEAGFEGPVPSASASATFSAEEGLSGSDTFTVSEESSSSAINEYGESLTTGLDIEKGSSLTREVAQAIITADVKIKNLSDIPFTLKNLTIIAYLQSPTNPTNLEQLAVLKSNRETNVKEFSINVGPKSTSNTLSFENDEIFSNVVEQLMKSPDRVVFKVSEYDIIAEDTRNYAFTEEDLKNSTAKFFIDYGLAGTFERNRIATFDADKNTIGITIATALEQTMGLKHYNEDKNPTATLTPNEVKNSYSTKVINGVETLWRMRGVARSDASTKATKQWYLITANGMNKSIAFRDFVLTPGSHATLSYAQDEDKDGVVARIEASRGSSDNKKNSDTDSLTDFEEVYVGWEITVTRDSGQTATERKLQVYPNPGRKDSDGDGLSDDKEKELGTDPTNPDTDGDLILDFTEVNGFSITVDGKKITIKTNPNDADSDDDGIKDGTEIKVGSNPKVSDADRFVDTDGDGLTDFQEKQGWEVTYYAPIYETITINGIQTTKSTTWSPRTATVTSDPEKKDTDGDGANDAVERSQGTHPRDKDTDNDGYEDNNPKGGNHLHPDDDLDGIWDIGEQDKGWMVKIDGGSELKVTSDPNKKDTDGDGVDDFIEKLYKSDPKKKDSDGDGATDLVEYRRLSDGKSNNDTSLVHKDQILEIAYTKLEIIDTCDFDDSEWIWNLYAQTPNGKILMTRSKEGREVTVRVRTITLTSLPEEGDKDYVFPNNPYVFVKRFSQSFNFEGRIFENDGDGDEGSNLKIEEDFDSVLSIDNSTENARYSGEILKESTTVEFERITRCRSKLTATIRVLN